MRQVWLPLMIVVMTPTMIAMQADRSCSRCANGESLMLLIGARKLRRCTVFRCVMTVSERFLFELFRFHYFIFTARSSSILALPCRCCRYWVRPRHRGHHRVHGVSEALTVQSSLRLDGLSASCSCMHLPLTFSEGSRFPRNIVLSHHELCRLANRVHILVAVECAAHYCNRLAKSGFVECMLSAGIRLMI